MNNKGFSMIELLGVIVIIGILFAVALPAVTKYIGKTRNRAYDNIYESAYSAAQGKYMNDLQTGNTEYDIRDLYNQGYMDEPIDPSNKGFCDGKVFITEDDSTEVSEYTFKVKLDCTNECRVYYSGKKSKDNGKKISC